MLHTPLKHAVPAHAPAQHPMAATRCNPHNPQPHELNLSDWLHMSPAQVMSSFVYPPLSFVFFLFFLTFRFFAFFFLDSARPYAHQVAMMSPAPAPAPSPAMHYTPPITNQLYGPSPSPLQYGMRNDFIVTTASLPYYAHPYPSPSLPTPNSNFPMQVPIISVEDTYQPAPYHHQHPSDYAQHAAALDTSDDASLLLSFAEYFQYTSQSNAPSPSPVAHHHSAAAEAGSTPVTTLSGVEDGSQSQTPAPPEPASASSVASPIAPAKGQSKPVESLESPFRIAQPQPRTFTPVDTTHLSELAEVASRQSTPSQMLSRSVSRPLLRTQLAVAHPRPRPRPLETSKDALVERQRGPLEFEKDGHRYRTRSKLKSLKAEIQEREREADLALIRRGLNGPNEEASSLELLASVSVTRRLQPMDEDEDVVMLKGGPTVKAKRGVKRSLRDVDTESTASSSDARQSPSKKARGERAGAAAVQKVDEAPLSLRTRARTTRTAKESPVRAASARGGSIQKARKAKSGRHCGAES
ncbi:hypothetical protein EW145_g8304 [Phellinidium pouzarii]|uniref:Uncharacterized protein n=1 Tax=Phellinidium pouzarii TaxID=167371 RepID=A0A4S4K7A4_9AGAM|nr:hypothetical protein EW145_g8304 [Phellinidium pouzarii]